MSDEQKMIRNYTPEMVELAMQIWMRSSISLIDIRSKKIMRSKPLENYLLPTNMFIYTYSTSASIILNKEPCQTSAYSLCHASKGTLLSIIPIETDVETFMILYRTEAIPFHNRKLRSLLEAVNPFTQIYAFTPRNPLFFMEKYKAMLQKWNEKASIHQFHAKTLFHQVIHQIYWELNQGNIHYIEPDYVEWVKEYLDEHYNEQISIQLLTDKLPISRSLLGRLFRKRENISLQEYLIKKRIAVAQTYLEHTQASIPEIAIGCGFTDELNMNRMFNKYLQMPPGEYRRKRILNRTSNSIDNDYQLSYDEKGLKNLVKSQKDGEFNMFRQVKSKDMLLAAAISLMLLLSACSSNVSTNNGGNASDVSAKTPVTQSSQNAEPTGRDAVAQTRIIKTKMGDVEIPMNPKRVVVDYVIGDVVALGVTPLGVAKAKDGGEGTVFAAQITESIMIESWSMEPEEIMALEPDLIILAFSDKPYEALTKVAPTVFVPYGELTTEERVRYIGDILNKTEEAEIVLATYNKKLADSKQALQNAGLFEKTVTVGQFGDKDNYIAGAKHAVGVVVYNELGLKAPPKVQADIIDVDEYWGDISMELLGEYAGDYMISLGEMSFDVNEHAVWKAVPAVQKGHLLSVDTSITWYSDIMSSMALVDIIVDQLLEWSSSK